MIRKCMLSIMTFLLLSSISISTFGSENILNGNMAMVNKMGIEAALKPDFDDDVLYNQSVAGPDTYFRIFVNNHLGYDYNFTNILTDILDYGEGTFKDTRYIFNDCRPTEIEMYVDDRTSIHASFIYADNRKTVDFYYAGTKYSVESIHDEYFRMTERHIYQDGKQVLEEHRVYQGNHCVECTFSSEYSKEAYEWRFDTKDNCVFTQGYFGVDEADCLDFLQTLSYEYDTNGRVLTCRRNKTQERLLGDNPVSEVIECIWIDGMLVSSESDNGIYVRNEYEEGRLYHKEVNLGRYVYEFAIEQKDDNIIYIRTEGDYTT